jgi:hypothetical protein
MHIPYELLYTFAQSAVAYAGLSALALVVVQLAGAKWQSQMTTGFWLVIAWSLGAFVFSLMPVVIEQFGLGTEFAVSLSSILLSLFISVVISGALRRDIRLLRSGVVGAAKPPVLTMIFVGSVSYLTSILLVANAFSMLPGPTIAWYLASLLETCIFAIIPLVHLVAAVHHEE